MVIDLLYAGLITFLSSQCLIELWHAAHITPEEATKFARSFNISIMNKEFRICSFVKMFPIDY